MRNNLKDLERRVTSLEQQMHPPLGRGLSWLLPLDAAKRNGLTPGQRIVEDDYENDEGETLMSVERITSDPSDIGKRFLDGSWNRKAFEQYVRSQPMGDIEFGWITSKPKPVGSLPGTTSRWKGARPDADAAAVGMDRVPSICPDGEPKPEVDPIAGLCSAEGTGGNADILTSEGAHSDRNE
jgi:hypothetical protein